MVITIIVMIIIAGAIILSLSNGNVISKAKEARYKAEIDTLRQELIVKTQDYMAENMTSDISSFNGSVSSVLGSKYAAYDSKYIITNGTLCITNVATPEEYSYAKSSGINMQVSLTNILLNADFSQLNADGITPKYWNLEQQNGTTSYRAENNRMYVKGQSNYLTTNIYSQTHSNRTVLKDEIYYSRLNECYTSWDTNTTSLHYGIMFAMVVNYSPSAIIKTVNNQETVVSYRYKATQNYTNPYFAFKPSLGFLPAPTNPLNIESYITKPVLINLTASFGSGNEPTEAWCNANIPFFVTSTVISY